VNQGLHSPKRMSAMLTAIFVTSACLGLGGFSLSSEASAAGKKGTVNLGQLNRLAAQNSDGMACAYEKPAVYIQIPAVSVPRSGSAIAAVGRNINTDALSLFRVDASTKKSALVGGPIPQPASGGANRVCNVVANDGVSTIAVQIIAPNGSRQWLVAQPGSDVTTPLSTDLQTSLTPSAAVSPDGSLVYVVAATCANCADGSSVQVFDSASGQRKGTFALPEPATSVDLAAHAGGLVVSAETSRGLHLWSLSPTTDSVVAERVIANDASYEPAITDSCSRRPGINAVDDGFIITAKKRLDFSELLAQAGLDPETNLPTQSLVRVLDNTTLEDRVALEASAVYCPVAGPGRSSLLIYEDGYSTSTGALLGSLKNADSWKNIQDGTRAWGTYDSPLKVNAWGISYQERTPKWVYPSPMDLLLASNSSTPTWEWTPLREVMTSPALQARVNDMNALLEGDYSIYGLWFDDEHARVEADFERQGSTIRYVKPHGYWKERGLKIVYSNPQITCSRSTTKAFPNTYKADRKAKWSCSKGSGGWKRINALAESAVEDWARSFQKGAESDAYTIVKGTNLESADERVVRWGGAGLRSQGTVVACLPTECRIANYYNEFTLEKLDHKIPRLTKSGDVR